MRIRPGRQPHMETFASALLFLMPALALSTRFGLGAVQAAILLLAAGFANKGMARFYADNWPALRWVLAGLAAYFLTTLLRLPFTQRGLALLDGPARLLLAASCIGFAGWLRPNPRALWLGLCAGAIGAAALALWQRGVVGIERAEGFTGHSITFGDLSMAMGLMALCGLPDLRKSRLALLPLAALLCGVLASILSASRGGWLALPLCLIPLLLGQKQGRSNTRLLLLGGALAAALFAAATLIPAGGVARRAAEAVSQTEQYFQQGDATTSVGIRLALWKASWQMFTEHPWLGVGRDAFPAALRHLAQLGQLPGALADEFNNSHNDILFALASGGLLDLGILLTLYLAPLALFGATLRRGDPACRAAALAGVVLVLSFMLFGLTEVMLFGRMYLKTFYAMTSATLIGLCLPAPRAAGPPAS